MFRPKNPFLFKALLLALFFLLIEVSCLSLIPNLHSLVFQPDSGSYLQLAANLVEKGIFSLDGTTPTARREPGYPLWIAAFMKAGLIPLKPQAVLELWPLLLGQVLLYFAAVLLMARMTLRRYGEIAASWTCLCAALALPLSLFSGQVLSEVFFIFVITAFLAATARYFESGSAGWLCLGALLMGCACMVKAYALMFVPLLALFMSLPPGRKLHAMLFLILAGAGPALWCWRHSQVMGRPILMTTDGGSSLYRGNLTYGHMVTDLAEAPPEVRQQLAPLSQSDQDRLMGRLALQSIRENPLAFLGKFMYKAYYLLLGSPVDTKSAILFLFRFGILFFALRNLLHILLREDPWDMLIIAFSVYTIVVYSAILTTPRYFAPCLFLLLPWFVDEVRCAMPNKGPQNQD